MEDAMIESEKGWHVIRFKIRLLNASEPNSALVNDRDSPLHTLIANEILRPCIEKYGENGEAIFPWRFHREYVPQQNRHIFTFRYCALRGSSIAINIKADIETNVAYREVADLLLAGTDFSEKGPDGQPGLWSDEMNRCWPHFIFGVSRAWLELIKVLETGEGMKAFTRDTFENRLRFYGEINRLIAEQWLKFGDHSMLHHLNAVFGYNPTIVRIGLRFGKGQVRSLSMHFDPLATNAGEIPILLGLEGQLSF
jgi:hypothetical protein